jgi:hypothetical protein
MNEFCGGEIACKQAPIPEHRKVFRLSRKTNEKARLRRKRSRDRSPALPLRLRNRPPPQFGGGGLG